MSSSDEFDDSTESDSDSETEDFDRSSEGLFSRIPNEVLEKILSNLHPHQKCDVAQVCRRWSYVSQSEKLWKNLQIGFRWRQDFHFRRDFLWSHRQSIKRLDFEGCSRGAMTWNHVLGDMKMFADVCKNLKELDLRNFLPVARNVTTNIQYEQMTEILHRFYGLRRIEVSDKGFANCLLSKGLCSCEGSQHCWFKKRIQHLCLDTDVDDLRFLQDFQNLSTLTLKLGEHVHHLSSLTADCPSLRHLSIKDVFSPSANLLQLFEDEAATNCLQNLESLAVNEFGGQSRDQVTLTFPTGLQSIFRLCTKLKKLTLLISVQENTLELPNPFLHMPPQLDSMTLCFYFPNVQTLTCNSLRFCTHIVRALMEGCKLTHVPDDISLQCISKPQVLHLSEVLAKEMSISSSLIKTGIHALKSFKYECSSAKSWHSLLASVAQTPTLKTLSVMFKDVTSFTPENFWVQSLSSPRMVDRPQSTDVTHLSLTISKGPSETIVHFLSAAALPFFPHLSKFHLSAVASVLMRTFLQKSGDVLQNLEELHLSRIRFMREEFASLLRTCSKLQKLVLQNVEGIPVEQGKELLRLPSLCHAVVPLEICEGYDVDKFDLKDKNDLKTLQEEVVSRNPQLFEDFRSQLWHLRCASLTIRASELRYQPATMVHVRKFVASIGVDLVRDAMGVARVVTHGQANFANDCRRF